MSDKRQPGNPNFSSGFNPSKLRQEMEEPCNANFLIRVPQSWKDKLSEIPNAEIRKHLKLLISNEEE